MTTISQPSSGSSFRTAGIWNCMSRTSSTAVVDSWICIHHWRSGGWFPVFAHHNQVLRDQESSHLQIWPTGPCPHTTCPSTVSYYLHLSPDITQSGRHPRALHRVQSSLCKHSQAISSFYTSLSTHCRWGYWLPCGWNHKSQVSYSCCDGFQSYDKRFHIPLGKEGCFKQRRFGDKACGSPHHFHQEGYEKEFHSATFIF